MPVRALVRRTAPYLLTGMFGYDEGWRFAGVRVQKFHQSDFSQIRFDSDDLQVLSVSRREKHPDLPLVRAPVNFRVMRSDGKFSNRWGVNLNKKGDAYAYCRDNPNADRASLHASGNQRISISEGLAKSVSVDSSFRNNWNEPQFDAQAVATFSLLFPPWGVGLDPADFPKGVNNGELLIVGHREEVVVVSFSLVDTGRSMQGSVPHIVLGELPARKGKTLHVIAWTEPQGKLMEVIRKAFPQAQQDLASSGLDAGEFTMHVQGYRGPDSAFMVVFPVRYTLPKSEEIIRDTFARRRKAMEALADR